MPDGPPPIGEGSGPTLLPEECLGTESGSVPGETLVPGVAIGSASPTMVPGVVDLFDLKGLLNGASPGRVDLSRPDIIEGVRLISDLMVSDGFNLGEYGDMLASFISNVQESAYDGSEEDSVGEASRQVWSLVGRVLVFYDSQGTLRGVDGQGRLINGSFLVGSSWGSSSLLSSLPTSSFERIRNLQDQANTAIILGNNDVAFRCLLMAHLYESELGLPSADVTYPLYQLMLDRQRHGISRDEKFFLRQLQLRLARDANLLVRRLYRDFNQNINSDSGLIEAQPVLEESPQAYLGRVRGLIRMGIRILSLTETEFNPSVTPELRLRVVESIANTILAYPGPLSIRLDPPEFSLDLKQRFRRAALAYAQPQLVDTRGSRANSISAGQIYDLFYVRQGMLELALDPNLNLLTLSPDDRAMVWYLRDQAGVVHRNFEGGQLLGYDYYLNQGQAALDRGDINQAYDNLRLADEMSRSQGELPFETRVAIAIEMIEVLRAFQQRYNGGERIWGINREYPLHFSEEYFDDLTSRYATEVRAEMGEGFTDLWDSFSERLETLERGQVSPEIESMFYRAIDYYLLARLVEGRSGDLVSKFSALMAHMLSELSKRGYDEASLGNMRRDLDQYEFQLRRPVLTEEEVGSLGLNNSVLNQRAPQTGLASLSPWSLFGSVAVAGAVRGHPTSSKALTSSRAIAEESQEALRARMMRHLAARQRAATMRPR